VLERDPYGGITVLSFGGDAHLGGDDVDARLARRLLERLQHKGYRLDLDLELPEDFSRFQRLKFYAEVGKKELSDQPEVTLVRQGLFEDKDGEIIDLDLTVTRQELEACAQDLIQRSIEASLATLAKHDIALETIDEVIMVGGMSRMPLVQHMLAAAFGRAPQVVDPDLIVARGAAIKAAEVFGEQAVAASGLRLELRYDRRTDKEHVRISGLFDRQLQAYTVYLINEADEHSQVLHGTDRFTFDHVALEPESENTFTLSVEDAHGTPVIERDITIVHDPQARPILVSPGSVVTRPIAVSTVDGLEVLFPENTALPHTVSHTFETADQSGQIVAPIWEGTHEVARLEIKDIPRDLKVGAPVVIEVRVESDYHIEARARVPDIKREVSIRFRIEPIDTSRITPAYVRQRLAALDQEAESATANCPSAEAVEIFRLRYALLQDQIEVELAEPEPKRAKLHEKLSELSALIESLPTPDKHISLEPSFDDFSARLADIVSQAIENNHPKLPSVRPQIDELRTRARMAWENKDPIAWRRINDQVAAIASVLQPERSPEDRALGMAAWLAISQVAELQQAAAGRYAQEIEEIEGIATEIFFNTQLKVLDPQQAIGRLIGLYRERVEPLRKRLGLASAGEPKVADPSTMTGTVRRRRGA
jgi:molecular chaperone DnaK (HSP70)